MNISKSGTSWSVGPRGAKVNFGKRGTYVTTGIPGTGIYSRTKVSSNDNTLQIINDLASIDENLDIRYIRDLSGESWETQKNGYVYKVSLIPKADKFDIKVCKTKEGKTTNCGSQCSNNIDNTQVISKLEAIFAKL